MKYRIEGQTTSTTKYLLKSKNEFNQFLVENPEIEQVIWDLMNESGCSLPETVRQIRYHYELGFRASYMLQKHMQRWLRSSGQASPARL